MVANLCKISSVYLVLVIVGLSRGLYEDQINKFDWKKEYIGKITDVAFDNALSISKTLFAITEKNVLASLSAKNGQLNWRQLADSKFERVVQYTDGLLTITSDGIIRIWDPATGLLKWDINLPYENKEEHGYFEFLDLAVLEMSYTEGNLIAILSTNALYTIRVQSGGKLKFKLKALNVENSRDTNPQLYVDPQSKKILLLSVKENSYISAIFYDAKTLEVANEQTIHTSWLEDSMKIAVLEGNKLVYLSTQMEALYVIDMQKGTELLNEPLSSLDISLDIAAVTGMNVDDLTSVGSDFFLSLKDGTVAHLRLDEDNKISVVAKKSSSSSNPARVIVRSVGSERYYFVVTSTDRILRISCSDVKTGQEDKSLDTKYQLPPDVGEVDDIFINMFLKRTSPVGYRVLVVTSDDSVLMLTTQPSRLSWSREESLASVVSAEMLDLPLSDIEAGIEVEFEEAEKHSMLEMFINRISAQIGQIRSFGKQLTRGIKEGTLFEKKTKDPLIQVDGLTRDPFSLHKMLVLVTEKGKLFGIDSLTGEIVWRLNVVEMNGYRLKLFVQRTTSHFPNPPSALLLGTSREDPSRALFLTFNPITGDLVGKNPTPLSEHLLQVMLLPFTDSAYLRPTMFLDENLNVHLVPDTKDIRSKLQSAKESIFVYRVDKELGLMQGYKFAKDLIMEVTWSIKIPADQEVIAVEGKAPYEKVDSMGRPLANRSVIYKYLNPNLVAVVTSSKDSGADKSNIITLYLIDGITGHIIHTAVHRKATGPTHVVHTENWLLYTYWNTKARRTEVASIELYEGKELYNSTTFSSFSTRPGGPLIIQQGYIFPTTINAMGVSRTERGLTSRQILIGMSQGSIVGMPRRLFDPRRPLHAEMSHREEGLIPYSPEIQFPPGLFVNYNKTVQRMTGIYSCPSALESTSIVFVTGLDLFFTRTQPSKMFDVLKDDFDHILIGAVLTGMFAAAIVTRKLAQNKKLNKAWR